MRRKFTRSCGCPVRSLLAVGTFLVVMTCLGLACSWNRHGSDVPPPDPPAVYVVGTQEYGRRCSTFEVTPEQARKLAESYVEKHGVGNYGPPKYHFLVVGDEYLFTPMYGKDYVMIYGYFVDGHTGKVSATQKAPIMVTFSKNPELKRAVEGIVADEQKKRRTK